MKMKKFTIVLTILIALTIKLNAQIPNSGFENWTTVGSYEEADGWINPNSQCTGSFFPITKSTDAYPIGVGTYSIRLESNPSLMPNNCALGITWTGQYPNVKFPITGHPTSLTGWYKYLPQGGDTMTINVVLYNNTIPVVPHAIFSTTATVSTWTSFTITFPTYSTADSASIYLSTYALVDTAGGVQNNIGPSGNSVLYVDNLNFDNLITSVQEQTAKKTLFNLYPNPASDIVTLNIGNTNNTDLTLNIYNVIGTLVKSEMLKQNTRQINIGDLNNGVYMLSIKANDRTENKRLIIQR
jgi:hypothetical protein